jgi:hypothetical protein
LRKKTVAKKKQVKCDYGVLATADVLRLKKKKNSCKKTGKSAIAINQFKKSSMP